MQILRVGNIETATLRSLKVDANFILITMKKQFLVLVCALAQLMNIQYSYASGGNGVVIGNGGGKKQDITSAFMSKTMFNFQNVQLDVLQEPYNPTGDPIIISNPKKRDYAMFLIVDNNTGGGSILATGGKKQDYVNTYDTGGSGSTAVGSTLDNGGKKKDYASVSWPRGSGTTSGSTGTLGLAKKKDFVSVGEPIKISTMKKQDHSSFDSGGNGQVISNGGLKRDLCESGGTGVSSGSNTLGLGGLGKKNDFSIS